MNASPSASLPRPHDLSRRFALTGGVVMVLAMLAIGYWVSSRIEQRVVDNTASATALFMDSFIAPLAQDLDTADTLSIGPIRAIEEMLSGSALGERIVAVKIWTPDGRVAYSDEPALIGQIFEPGAALRAALSGEVVAELDELGDEENATERAHGIPLLEIYSPLREEFSGRILGVLEFYENATALEASLARTRLQSWLIVASVTAAIGTALFGIVHSGSRLIAAQQAALTERMAETRRVSDQNRQLRLDIERASRGVAEVNEQLLRRVSADLHDGPAQLVSFAALRLDAAGKIDDLAARQTELATVRAVLDEAMREIRNLCADLSLPEIEQMPLGDILHRVVAAHRSRTGTAVRLDIVGGHEVLPHSIGICAYRFVQETLTNAWRHAGGADQSVDCTCVDGQLAIVVANGAGAALPLPETTAPTGLGLPGLRQRVASLGGTFRFERLASGAARVDMTLNLQGPDIDV
ncbi:sensor histidine kinase [Methylobrevis pamukkalensis]|uniref:histidine kinase n=1 Tax=Methylobrevis pamukkalensis TaxID=1439726 RepID=A0A1E3H7X0_9HYPH|nr:histidine kinase [Methylobrevis pamukkalensis]ODN72404.1 Signal transduction histidine-protein kinase/phosphatase DegS [Methylobrevis pamukkalensis]